MKQILYDFSYMRKLKERLVCQGRMENSCPNKVGLYLKPHNSSATDLLNEILQGHTSHMVQMRRALVHIWPGIVNTFNMSW